MKKIILPILIVLFNILSIKAQDSSSLKSDDKYNSFSVQIFKHALGVDYERRIYNNFGMALSGGLSGAEVEFKYHFKPNISSPSVGFATGVTWYSIEDLDLEEVTVKTSMIYMFFYEYRAKKNLVFTAGLGWFDYEGEARIRARGGIGFYFPW